MSVILFLKRDLKFNGILRILSLLCAQFFIFILAFFAYFSIFKEGEVISKQSSVVYSILFVISITKFFYFFLLKIYRSSGKNFRSVIVIGDSKSAQDIVSIFNDKQYLGYRFSGYFSLFGIPIFMFSCFVASIRG